MWESLFGSAVAPALTEATTQGIGEAMIPTITDTLATQGADQALAGTLPNMIGSQTAGLGVDQAFQQLGTQFLPANMAGFGEGMVGQASMNAIPQTGMFEQLGGFGKSLLGDQTQNIAKVGLGGYNAYNQGKAINQAKRIQDQQMAMSQDAYNRDKSADQRRQKLVF